MTTLPPPIDGTPDEERDLAAEHALGLLSGDERREAERRAARDPAFARALEDWTARLAPLAEAIEPVEPPPGARARLERRLDRLTRTAPAAASLPARGVAAFWRWLGIGGFGLAASSLAALAFVLLSAPEPADRGAMFATLAGSDGRPLFTVVIDRASAMATLVPVAVEAQPGRVPELWLVGPAGAAPRSLGLVGTDHPLRMVMEGMDAMAPDTALAVSLEPEGGSPTGLPTGPVLASGAIHTI
ncbi:anti-sigma factor [Aurantimonas sp. Leaf443]|uniref:anti-sigma factor n=1 Tax=Aurantimonas sp. Leaf443 TaxID=1736378 RepID=UPI0006FCD966|nr:anti-sigma factor [Aurantimonas sp. Leaf443]KQT83152.1 hypothetical protein ASG48_14385 [Aurantimonas sp. Leaf443]